MSISDRTSSWKVRFFFGLVGGGAVDFGFSWNPVIWSFLVSVFVLLLLFVFGLAVVGFLDSVGTLVGFGVSALRFFPVFFLDEEDDAEDCERGSGGFTAIWSVGVAQGLVCGVSALRFFPDFFLDEEDVTEDCERGSGGFVAFLSVGGGLGLVCVPGVLLASGGLSCGGGGFSASWSVLFFRLSLSRERRGLERPAVCDWDCVWFVLLLATED